MTNPTSNVLNENGAAQFMTDALTGATIRLRLSTTTGLTATSAIGDVSTNELSGNGYPAGGVPLTFSSAAWDSGDSRVEALFSTANLTPSGANLTWRQGTVTISNGTDHIWSTFTWAADETATDGIAYPFTVKLTFGPQGSTVDITDS